MPKANLPRKTRFAIIEFDPDRLSQLDTQAEGFVFARMVKLGLLGQDHPTERGIIRILPCASTMAMPQAGIDGEMIAKAV